jgi:TolB-like protein
MQKKQEAVMGIIRELKERRLFQIALSYVGAGWVVLEVLDQLVGRGILGSIGNLLYQIALIWVVVGIPAAVLIAWHHGERGEQKAPLSEVVALVLLAVLATGLSGSTILRERNKALLKASAEEPLQIRNIAVLYFRDETANAEQQYLADGLTESLISELSQVRELSVISRNGTAQYRGSELEPDSIGRILDVGTVVEGSIGKRGDKLRINIDVVDAGSGARFAEKAFEGSAQELLALRDKLVTETAEILRRRIGEEIRVRTAAIGTSSTVAWTMLQRGEKARKDADALVRQDPVASAARFEEADKLFEQASQQDAAWVDPWVARSALAYRRSRIAQSSPPDAIAFVQSGLKYAEEALSRDKTSARAFELRGTMNYFLWLLRATPDPEQHAKLFTDAKADLESAIKFDPRLASAHATLSHLYYQSDIANAMVAAKTALQEDAYLESADVVLWRLFNGSIELSNFTPAQQACNDGTRRFPNDYRFVNCQLRMLTVPSTGAHADSIGSAWALLAKQDSLTPAPRLAFEHTRGEMIVAGVIARAAQANGATNKALQDSARSVLSRARAKVTPQMDPVGELMTVEAYIRVLNQEQDAAIALLERIKARDPEQFTRNKGEVGWWWRGLSSHPKFNELFGLQ